MTDLAPTDDTLTIEALNSGPFPIYQRLRREAPVLRVTSLGRTLLTKAADTRHVKDNPEIFSSDDPNTPMKRAFQAHTLMRKDGAAHLRERMAMAPAFAPGVITGEWMPRYEQIASEFVARLPRGEVVDLFPALSGPYAARGLAVLLGLEEASDSDLQRWSQTLIDGAGNFGWAEAPFMATDAAHLEMNALMDRKSEHYLRAPDNTALSVMLNAHDPIERAQMYSNIKIAIGGGINEPRDALNTIVFGLLSNPDQLAEVKRNNDWVRAFEEGIRWIAPISASSRLVTQDTEMRGHLLPKGETVMTIQASANRDEEVYDNPEAFDVYREKKPHQAFGNGPHFCMGTHVARRAVGQIMLPKLFERFPNMSLPEPEAVTWHGFGFHGITSLPVRLD